MKILFIKSDIHHKNLNFILKCKKINFYIVDSINAIQQLDLGIFDAVISPCDAIDVTKYPNVKFIFGPQFSVFPEERLTIIKGSKTVYNLLSNWVINIWKKFPVCNNLNVVALPFGVDTEKFIDNKSITEKNRVIVYFKHRNPQDVHFIERFLKDKHIAYTLFSYNTRYDENNYINCLQNTKFCIWVDAHESQGFALQEALSCNVPLLVWNITSMNQEYGSNYQNLPATTIPYWDERCGEVFYNITELEEVYNKFINNLGKYKPREYILENLSIDVCENKLIELINIM
jgi:hypothetical protein